MKPRKRYPFLAIILFCFSFCITAQAQSSDSKQDEGRLKTQKTSSTAESKDIIYTKVDVLAGLQSANELESLRRPFMQNFNLNDLAGLGQVQTEIRFVVEKDGSITNIESEGNNKRFNQEAKRAFEKTIKKLKWKPAQLHNEAVRSQLKIPVVMDFP